MVVLIILGILGISFLGGILITNYEINKFKKKSEERVKAAENNKLWVRNQIGTKKDRESEPWWLYRNNPEEALKRGIYVPERYQYVDIDENGNEIICQCCTVSTRFDTVDRDTHLTIQNISRTCHMDNY